MQGGVCHDCGAGINLIQHDWVFGDDKIVREG